MSIPIKFAAEKTGAERRVFPRREVHADIEYRRLDESSTTLISARQQMTLRDVSLGGLSALSNRPLKPNEKLNVFFPRMGATNPWDAQGRVIRCEESSMGYRVAVEFDPLPLAA